MANRLNTCVNGWKVKEFHRNDREYVIECMNCHRVKTIRFEPLYRGTLKRCPCHLKIAYKTKMQMDIYKRLKSGMMPIEIAKELGITRQAVSFHIKHMEKEYKNQENFIDFLDI